MKTVVTLLLLAAFTVGAYAQPIRECLVLPVPSGMLHSIVHTDPVQALQVSGAWTAPKVGDTVVFPDGSTRQWEAVAANAEGWFEHPALRNGYAYAVVSSDREKVALLEAQGCVTVVINGEPRVGDVYQHGYVRIPVLLKQGQNELLFRCSRAGRLSARLSNAPAEGALLDVRDATLPDLVVGEETDVWLGIVAINASMQSLRGLTIVAAHEGGRTSESVVPALPPLSIYKVPVRVRGLAPRAAGARRVELRLLRQEGKQKFVLDSAEVTLRIRETHESQKRTFISSADGSVQYYAVLPAQRLSRDSPAPALVLTLHGAGVEAIGQVDSYSPKTWATIVAPTNRRPFGFSWEEWGRLDALEVLELAQKRWRTDPYRVYLTGHSMGGHGTWHVGLTHPDRFAAIAPSAGWVSIWTYGTGARLGQREQPADEKADPIAAFLLRSASPSDTLSLVRNSLMQGVYVLHGDADEVVPVTESRSMHKSLSPIHRDFEYHEQPGAGHWWDLSDEPGVDCVDWMPIFNFFARRRLPTLDSVRQIEFTTMSPGVSASCYWVSVEMQQQQMKPSTVNLRYDPGKRRFAGTTSNVARLSLHLEHMKPGAPLSVELDGQAIGNISYPSRERRLWLIRENGHWKLSAAPSPALKSPQRYGGFKSVFTNRPVLVYGTKGTPEENAWALAKARFDSESFWYRGNATFEVIPDTEFQPDRYRDRNVVLYGNAETNATWQLLLGDSPVQVHRGAVHIGDKALSGETLACLFVRPRAGSVTALVGAVAGTGLVGMRLTNRLPYFITGAGVPDCLVLSADMLTKGLEGVLAAGFFGADWSVQSGEFVWR
ncbi:MAG: prolyl oligopeptidase family serine peptidase [Armatimonadota bacterium]|nr:prolyl oligopeptidase family serine peptidase [bacterium]MDW8322310.1 prolyl oligopeptidase family serine peptidase [Armatimonadota bacterium]